MAMMMVEREDMVLLSTIDSLHSFREHVCLNGSGKGKRLYRR